MTRSYFSAASAWRKRWISRQLSREKRRFRQRRSENGIARRTPSTSSTRSVKLSSTSQSIWASGWRRQISAMAGMLWTTSPSDDTRTIKIFCTLDTVGAVGLDGAWTILRWAEFTAGAWLSGWFLLALGGCLLAPADGFWVCRGGWSWVDGRVHGVFGLSGRGQCRVAAFGLGGLRELAVFFITISHCAWRHVVSLSKATKKRSKESAFQQSAS